MNNYLELLAEIMAKGEDRPGRNGGTRSLFVRELRFKMNDGYPAVTTKKLAFRSMAAELFWFMSGESDNRILQKLDCKIWNANSKTPYWLPKAKYEGDLGRIYGVQWRHWRRTDGSEVDQLGDVVKRIKNDPYSRRLLVSAWNPGELEEMALEPCHVLYQFYVARGKLSLHMNQRSCDIVLGVPFNIASYALLLHLVAQMTNLEPDELILTLGDTHIYHNHFDAVGEQLSRKPFPLPTLWVNPEIHHLHDVKVTDIKSPNDILSLVRLDDYKHHPAIKAEMSA
jgi:thymidylate synthase